MQETPRNSQRTLVDPQSTDSPDYDRSLQEQLQRDISFLNLGDTPLQVVKAPLEQQPIQQHAHEHAQPVLLPPMASTQQALSKLGPIKLPEIPPFRGNPQSLQKATNQPISGLAKQQLLPSQPYHGQNVPPKQPPLAQQPLPLLPSKLRDNNSCESMSSESSRAPTAMPTPAPASPNGELDALNDVIFPALEEALKRRQFRLQLAFRNTGSSAATPKQQRAQAAHDKLRKLVYKLAHICKEIDQWDKQEPVGMGKDVDVFLEGLLEEILVRVEPAEDDEVELRQRG
jgi:serine/threonine-protein kinase 24/25/MST4